HEQKERRGDAPDQAQRQALGRMVAGEYRGEVGRQHAERSSGNDPPNVMVLRGEQDRRDLRLVADLDQEERDQGGEKGAVRVFGRLGFGLVGDENPQRHGDEGKRDGPAQHAGRNGRAQPGAEPGGEPVIGERREQNAEDNRPRLAETGREHEREELSFVFYFGERHRDGGDEEGFQDGAFGAGA